MTVHWVAFGILFGAWAVGNLTILKQRRLIKAQSQMIDDLLSDMRTGGNLLQAQTIALTELSQRYAFLAQTCVGPVPPPSAEQQTRMPKLKISLN